MGYVLCATRASGLRSCMATSLQLAEPQPFDRCQLLWSSPMSSGAAPSTVESEGWGSPGIWATCCVPPGLAAYEVTVLHLYDPWSNALAR